MLSQSDYSEVRDKVIEMGVNRAVFALKLSVASVRKIIRFGIAVNTHFCSETFEKIKDNRQNLFNFDEDAYQKSLQQNIEPQKPKFTALKVGESYEFFASSEKYSFKGKVEKDFGRYYLINCENYVECINKGSLMDYEINRILK